MVVGLLGILKAGGAYVPLDPGYPWERLKYMLEDSAPWVLLTQRLLSEQLPVAEIPLLLLDDDALLASYPETNPDPRALGLTSQHLAYVIYTSGSTGTPKGVLVGHRAIVRLVRNTDYCRFGSEEVFLQFAPLSFDAATFELWGPLVNGSRLVVIPKLRVLEPKDFSQQLRNLSVTTAFLTTALFNECVRTVPGIFQEIDQILFGGETCEPECIRRALNEQPPRELVHVYGPTETTTFASYFVIKDLERGKGVPIGKPIANTQIYILDGRGEPVPVGVAGELYIGGAGVARGYLNRRELTAERFMGDRFVEEGGERMYRTGDLGRWRNDGNIEFLGRNDFQVKIRGFRIELGEIEARLREYAGVEQVVVMARDDVPGEQRLVAYYTTAKTERGRHGELGDEEEVVGAEQLRSHLSDKLPEYMVPAAYVRLKSMPLTPNGKLDRRALPEPERVSGEGYREPRTPEEEILCGLFAEVLGLERVGLDDDFFALGGHSLLAVSLVSRVRAVLRVELDLGVLFESPSVGQLSGRLREGGQVRGRLERRERPERIRLSYAQRRLWFIDRLEGTSVEYNVPQALWLKGELDGEALERAINTIVERHESLRTHFAEVEGEAVQVIERELRIAVPVEDVSGLGEGERREWVKAELRREAGEAFDLSRGPLLRVKLVKVGEGEHVLLRTMHHIVSDGWSQGVFNRELGVLYEAYAEGGENPLPPLGVQYADFAMWQREWLEGGALEEGLRYWNEELAGIPEQLGLPADRPRPAVQTYAAEVCQVVLGAEQLAGLKRLCGENQATLYMALMAGFGVLLGRYSGQEDIVVGSPIANRQDAQLEEMIGFFVNTLVMRLRGKGGMSFRELLGGVRETALGAYRHQDIPFERLVEELNPQRSLSRSPVYQVVFALQNAPRVERRMKGLEIGGIRGDDESRAHVDLEVHAVEQSG